MMASFSGALGVESRPRMCAYRWIAAHGQNPTLAASEAASPLKPVFKDANDSEETLAIAGETCATVGDYCLSGHRSKKNSPRCGLSSLPFVQSITNLNTWSNPNSSIAVPHGPTTGPITGRNIDWFSIDRFSVVHPRTTRRDSQKSAGSKSAE